MDTERKSKYGTISVSPEFLSKFRDFCDKCHIPQTEMMSAIFEPLFKFTEQSQHVAFGIVPKEGLNVLMICAFPMQIGNFPMPSNASQKEIDEEVKKRLKP